MSLTKFISHLTFYTIQHTLKMNVDKFGHYIHKRMRLSELIEFNENALLKSASGEFDLKFSKLKGVKPPIDADDAVNKNYVDQLTAQTTQELNKMIGSLRSQIMKDAQKTVLVTLKATKSEISPHYEDKFYTKAEVDNLLEKIHNGKTASSK